MPAAKAYGALWVDIQERLAGSALASPSRKVVRTLLQDLRKPEAPSGPR